MCQHLSDDATIKLGEIGGIMRFPDHQFRCDQELGQYYIFADAFDPLVDAGWTIVQEQDEFPQAN